MGFLNTHLSGSVRSIIFKQGDEWFAVALEFNIVETGNSPQEVMVLLDEAIRGYVEGAEKARLSIATLNQNVDPEYESLWASRETGEEHEGKHLYSASTQPLTALAA
jgi:predicted RNase H-like HicB family nuclease